MNSQKIIPAAILAVLGFALVFFSIYLLLSGSTDVLGLKGQLVMIVGGLLIIVFAIFYVRNDEYSDVELPDEDDVEIIWEETDEDELNKDEINETEVNETESDNGEFDDESDENKTDEVK